MGYEILTCNDKKQWDDFVATSPQGNIFCQTQFLDVCQKDYELLFVRSGETNLLGAVIAKEKDGQPTLQSFMYQGMIFDISVASYPNHKRVKKSLGLVDFLLEKLEKRYDRVSFSLHHAFEDLRSFQWFNYHDPAKVRFQIDINYTAVLDLLQVNDFENLLMTARTVRRQEYRKCIKEGFMIEESEEIDILDQLHAKTFERQGIERTTGEKVMSTELAEAVLTKKFGKLLICKDRTGASASACLFLFDKKTGYYLIGANDPKYRKYGTGSYIMFEAIRRCMEQGLSSVDFVGVNSPMRGDFKTSFNAQIKPYYIVKLEKP